jgi:methionine-rich copper-binding protein CopC
MGGGIRRTGAVLAATVVGGLCALLGASPAAAHNSLTGSDPKDGARLDAPPAQVRLTFLAKLDPTTTKVTVTGPGTVSAAAGAPRFDGKVVEVDFTAGAAGAYTAAYEVASDDGHPIKGDITFTLTVGAPEPAPATGAPEPAPAPATSAPEPAPKPSGTTAPTAAVSAVAIDPASDADDGPPVWPWVALGAAVLVALGGGALALRSRRRGGD